MEIKTRKTRKQQIISPENLLKNKYPELLLLWNYDKNIDIDINTISYACVKKVHWLCPMKNREHDNECEVNVRTRINKNGKMSGCKKCLSDSRRLQGEKIVNTHIQQHIPSSIEIDVGNETELYVQKILIDMNYYENVTILGNIGADADISLIYNNQIYYCQVKTLTHLDDDNYYCGGLTGYPDNMLIIMVSEQRTRFALEFAGNIKTSMLSLRFNSLRSKYAHIMYKNIDIFKNKLKELIVESCQEITFSKNIFKEFLMLKRFETFCIKNNITYIRNATNSTAVDGTINGFRFQAKFASLNKPNCLNYGISSYKSYGHLNGQHIASSYKVGDFDYMIMEIGGIKNDEHKYENNFCIIPEKNLIDQNILKSDTCKGKTSFMICPPDYIRNHWSKKFWNNIPESLLSNKITDK